MNTFYFEQPVCLLYYDANESNEEVEHFHYCFGIGYKNTIVCGCCGAHCDIADIIADAIADKVEPFYVFPEWIDLADALYLVNISPEEWEDVLVSAAEYFADAKEIAEDKDNIDEYEQVKFDIPSNL